MKIVNNTPKFFRWMPVLLCVLSMTSVLRAGGVPGPRDSTYRQVITEGSKSLSCYLNYPQGSAKIIPDFENNSSELRKLDDFIRQVFRDSLIYVDSIRLSGYCSIEGSYGVNERLAKTRVMGFKNYLDNE